MALLFRLLFACALLMRSSEAAPAPAPFPSPEGGDVLTPAPVPAPAHPSAAPTQAPTNVPTAAPNNTSVPTAAPTNVPTTATPTNVPTAAETATPTVDSRFVEPLNPLTCDIVISGANNNGMGVDLAEINGQYEYAGYYEGYPYYFYDDVNDNNNDHHDFFLFSAPPPIGKWCIKEFPRDGDFTDTSTINFEADGDTVNRDNVGANTACHAWNVDTATSQDPTPDLIRDTSFWQAYTNNNEVSERDGEQGRGKMMAMREECCFPDVQELEVCDVQMLNVPNRLNNNNGDVFQTDWRYFDYHDGRPAYDVVVPDEFLADVGTEFFYMFWVCKDKQWCVADDIPDDDEDVPCIIRNTGDVSSADHLSEPEDEDDVDFSHYKWQETRTLDELPDITTRCTEGAAPQLSTTSIPLLTAIAMLTLLWTSH